MKIYELDNHIKSMIIMSYNDENHPISLDFDGKIIGNIWSPIKVETTRKGNYKDFPIYRIGKPVVSSRVKEILEPFVSSEVEFLPLIHEELDLYMINVLNIVDCVDWKRSDIRTFEDGSLAGFNKLVFDFDKISSDTFMFKFPERATTRVYVTEAFKDLIERNKFKGLNFSVEFDSEFTEEKELEQKRNYEAALKELEDYRGPEVSYEEARNLVDQGKTMASGKWRMKLDEKGKFWLGELILDLSYQWMSPIYIPPILLGQLWHEVEQLEN